MSGLGRFAHHTRHPGTWLRDVCGGEPVYPLVILFGLNAVDELDRTAFGILLPEIRETFDLDLTTTLAFVAAVSIAALALQVPIAQLADRRPRLPLMIGGAVCWALFAGLTGFATTLWVLGIARSGSAIGKAVIDPTHNSLLADYYPMTSRSRVLQHASRRQRRRRVRRADGRRAPRLPVRLAGAVLGLRRADARVRLPRAAAERTGPRALGA